MSSSYVEPWLREDRLNEHPVIAAVLHSLEHAREDLEKWTAGVPDDRLWTTVGEIASVGFQVRHIAGSVDRLITYAAGGTLSEAQMAELKREKEPGATRSELFSRLDEAFSRAAEIVRTIDPSRLGEVREIGRKRVRTTLGGLLIHVAEHTMRHVGETIITVKAVR